MISTARRLGSLCSPVGATSVIRDQVEGVRESGWPVRLWCPERGARSRGAVSEQQAARRERMRSSWRGADGRREESEGGGNLGGAEGYTDWRTHAHLLHTDTEDERESCHVHELPRFGFARRLACLSAGSGGSGGNGGARAHLERGSFAAALRHRSRSHKLAVVVTSPCGSRTHTRAQLSVISIFIHRVARKQV